MTFIKYAGIKLINRNKTYMKGNLVTSTEKNWGFNILKRFNFCISEEEDGKIQEYKDITSNIFEIYL